MYCAKNIAGSNSYWVQQKNNLKAIITQIGAPTIFWTLSCDDQTKIAWERIPLSEKKHLCCPEAVAVKVEQHAICRTFECKQKLRLPQEACSKIYCDKCKKALPLKKCRLTTTCEVTFEVGFKQYNLTIFNDVVNDFWGKLDREQLEDTVLNMEGIDVFYDNRRVVQKLQLHDESQEV